MKDYSYRGFSIVPKRDFGRHGYLDNEGRWIRKGWVAVKDGCNDMPGGTWFESLREAKRSIDVWIRVKGNADRFWEIVQPFEYRRVGQRADFESGRVVCGRFTAFIENFRVTRLVIKPRSAPNTALGTTVVRGTWNT